MKKNNAELWRAKAEEAAYKFGQEAKKYLPFFMMLNMLGSAAGNPADVNVYPSSCSDKNKPKICSNGPMKGVSEDFFKPYPGFYNQFSSNVVAAQEAHDDSEIVKKLRLETPVFLGGNLSDEIIPRGKGIKEDYRIYLRMLGVGEDVINETLKSSEIMPVLGDVAYGRSWTQEYGRNKQPVNISFKNFRKTDFEEDIGNFSFYSSPHLTFEKINRLPTGKPLPKGMYAFRTVPSKNLTGKKLVSKDDMPSIINESLNTNWAFPHTLQKEKRDWGAGVPGVIDKNLSSGAHKIAVFATANVSKPVFENFFNLIVNGNAGSATGSAASAEVSSPPSGGGDGGYGGDDGSGGDGLG